MTTRANLHLGVQEGYARWAKSYTSEPNPMFALEERLLLPLLPRLQGKHVLDLGCGTGRWLQRLSDAAAGSLTGVDGSPEMLAEARARDLDGVRLLQGDCLASGLAANSADVVLNSFVLSHITDLDRFASELKRVSRPGAHIFITDLHPDTARELNWKRAFRVGDDHVEIDSLFRPLSEIVGILQSKGLQLRALLEPTIGEQERSIFEHHHREDLFEAAAQNPAIVVLQLEPVESVARQGRATSFSLTGARVALDANEAVATNLIIDDSAILSIVSRQISPASDEIDLRGYLLLPGLINAHDHLDFALFPRLGNGGYQNAVEWAKDIYHPESDPIREQLRVPKDTRLLWGAIRNLLCGVTTVCHHNPPSDCLRDPDFPVRVVPNCVWAHSLAFDQDLEEKFRRRAPGELFIVHLAEGVDDASRMELHQLDAMEALDEGTIIIHGLALRSAEIAWLKQRRVGLVCCPSSNLFLFGRSIDADTFRGWDFVALGSDSPLTARGDLLDEIGVARGLGAAASDLYPLVTTNPAKMMGLTHGEGTLRPGTVADVIAVRDDGRSPAERLCSLSYKDVEMVLVGGKVAVASTAIFAKLSPTMKDGLELLFVEGVERWVRAPVGKLLDDARAALGRAPTLSGRRLAASNAVS